jgi:hypothetical protein
MQAVPPAPTKLTHSKDTRAMSFEHCGDKWDFRKNDEAQKNGRIEKPSVLF